MYMYGFQMVILIKK